MAEVYIEGKRLDVFEKLNFSFNYSIADIRDPKKRSTSYSKTVRCPSTANNDALFGQIYDLNISNAFDSTGANIEVNFNPNKKAKALVIADGVLVMEGSFQLRKIVRQNTELIYEAVFLGQLVSIFGILSDKMINGYEWDEATESNVKYIDFSDLDHYYNQDNQTTSWTAPYGEGYVYPMIDYGKTTEYHGADLWRKYKVTDLKPALYAKEILDRIFDFAGFTYQSTFLESAFFKRLIIPCRTQSSEESTSERLFLAQTKDQLLNNRRYPGYGLVNHTVGNDSRMGLSKSWALICFDNDSSAPAFDNGTFANFGNFWVNPLPFPAPPQSSDGWGSLDSGSYSWRVNEQTAGTYNLRSKVTVNFNEWVASYNDWDDFVAEIDMLYGLTQGESMNGKVEFWRRRANGNPPPTWEVTKLAETDISFPLHNVGMGTAIGYTGEVTVDLVAEEVEVYDGDAIFMVINFEQSTDGTNATGYSPAMDFSIMGSGIWYTLVMTTTATFYNEHISGSELVDSEWLEFNNNLPEISMADYLLSLINMFNLYVWFEVMLIASFVLMALGGERAQMEGALKYVTLNLMASAVFLAAVGILYGVAGTLNMADLATQFPAINPGLVNILAMMFLVAFGIKAAVFPLFFWLPAAYHTPPAAVSAIFAGLLTKVGVYAMIRVFTSMLPKPRPIRSTAWSISA